MLHIYMDMIKNHIENLAVTGPVLSRITSGGAFQLRYPMPCYILRHMQDRIAHSDAVSSKYIATQK